MSVSTFTQLRASAAHDGADAVAARDADGDHPRARRRRRALLLSRERALRLHRQCLRRRPEGADHAGGVGQGRAHRRGRRPAAGARRRAVLDRSRALPPGGAGGRGEAGARQDRLRQPQELRSPASAKQIELARQSVAANQADFDRKTSLLNNRISTPADLDKSRMALLAAKALLEQLQQQEATVRNQLLGDMDLRDREISPVHGGDRRPASAPGAIWPIPCCARPSPASPRR